MRGERYHTILYAYISCYYNTTQSIYRKLVVTIPKQHLHSSNIQPFEEVEEEEEVKQLMLMLEEVFNVTCEKNIVFRNNSNPLTCLIFI